MANQNDPTLDKRQERHLRHRRLREILSVFRKYNVLSNLAHKKNPAQVREAFEALGPTFIKMGQMLATRTDLVPPTYIRELSKLQDNVPADSFEVVKSTIESETHKTMAEMYLEFDHKPFASASMGQVHHAKLLDGQHVVVKIQHPEIRKKIVTDLALLQQAIKILRYVPDAEAFNPQQIFNELKRSLLSELNTKQELENGARFYNLNNGWNIIEVPQVYPDESAEKVLVNQFLPGKSIKKFIEKVQVERANHSDKLEQQSKYLANVLVKNFLKQVFDDGFFHADPHPGNILLYQPDDPAKTQDINSQPKRVVGDLGDVHYQFDYQKDESMPSYRIVYLDFGMMGTIEPELQEKIATAVYAIGIHDERKIALAVINLCRQDGPIDEENFTAELNRLLAPLYEQGLGQIDFRKLIYQIIKVCQTNHLQMNSDVTLLVKSFGTLEGTIQQLNPELSMFEVARPFAWNYFKQHFNLKNTIQKDGIELFNNLRALPQLAGKSLTGLEQLTQGDLKLNLNFKQQDEIMHSVSKMIDRIAIALVLAATIVGSSLLVQDQRDPFVERMGMIGYIISVIIIVYFLIKHIYHRIRRWYKRGRH